MRASCASSHRGTLLISFEQVGKAYRTAFGGRVQAVTDVTFEVAPGEVMGIAGPNGAGKSTLIALLLGLFAPSSGAVRIHSRAPREFAEHEGIGYLPELIPLEPRWRASTALHRMAILSGLDPATRARAVSEVIEKVSLSEHQRKLCKQLSKGNLQKVGLAQSLLADTRVYVFDEPTHGLDPVGTQRFREIVTEIRRPDRSMLVASHNLDELERICDRVAIIDHGRIQRVVDLRAAAPAQETSAYRIRATANVPAILAEFPGSAESAPGDIVVPAIDPVALNRGLARAIAAGAIVTLVIPAKSALERQFHDVVATTRPGAKA
jgi:ABC-type multidrug transport system ATPase subunit